MKMRVMMLMVLACGLVRAVSQDVLDMEAKRQARSVHLGYREIPAAQAVYGEVTVRECVPGTYFCAIGFNGGYLGIQEQSHGKKVAIFSVWEPGNPMDFTAHPDKSPVDTRTKVLYEGENVRIKRFGGEGTGGQSMMDFDWKVGQTYRFCVSAESGGGEWIAFTGWLYREETQSWFKIATFNTVAVKGKPRVSGVYSFIEDFRRNYESAKQMRRADFTNFAAFDAEKKQWIMADKAQFTGDRNPVMTVDAGPINNGFFLQTGGETKNTTAPLWSVMTAADVTLREALRKEFQAPATK